VRTFGGKFKNGMEMRHILAIIWILRAPRRRNEVGELFLKGIFSAQYE
jgi:hypothetical protein